MPENTAICTACGKTQGVTSPLTRFSYFYVGGGLAFIILLHFILERPLTRYLMYSWAAVGIALALIVFGRSRRAESDSAGLMYLLGIAWLILLFVVGIVFNWQQLTG